MKRFACLLCFMIFSSAVSWAQLYDFQWAQQFNGSAFGHDQATSATVDSEGDLVLTGYSMGAGNDFATIKYSSSGTTLWTNRYNGPASGDDRATGIAVFPNGDVVVAGFSPGSTSGNDITALKYSRDGVPLWTNRYNGPANGDDRAVSVKLATNGNVVVIGHSQGAGTGYDFVAISYSSLGAAIWTNRYNGIEGFDDFVTAGGVSLTGDVVLVGYSQDTHGPSASLIIAYSGDGVPLWTNRFRRLGSVSNQHRALAFDSEGSVIVTGTSYIAGFDCATIKYSSTGVPLWTNIHQGPSTSAEYGNAVVIGSDDTSFVAGYATNYAGPSGEDFLTLAYSSAGVPLWTNLFSSTGKFSDRVIGLALGGDDRIYVTGYSFTADYDVLTIAYTLGGTPVWTNTYSGTALPWPDAVPTAITCYPHRSLFIVGYTWNGTSLDYLATKYALLQPAPVIIQRFDNQAILSWTNTGFSLQSAPSATGTFTNISGATSPHTNSITSEQEFFRLISN